ncbi:MAG: hypothetical protein IJ111_13505 [Eggerthellaceae bacterium]|nr:hypothetical protein [Eggerthellaceae bacterium]
MEGVKALDMTQRQMMRHQLVLGHLDPMIGYMTGWFVNKARYMAYTCGHEAVTLSVNEFGWFNGDPYKVVVDITDCKNQLAITERVLKAVGEIRFTGRR